MRILFLSRWFPFPADNGSKLRVANLLRGLADCHQVDLISFTEHAVDQNSRQAASELCSQVHAVPWIPYTPYTLRAVVGFFHPMPRSLRDTYSSEMAQTIQTSLARRSHDLVIASQIDTARYWPCFQERPALFEELEIGLPYQKYYHASGRLWRLRYSLTWHKFRRYLVSLLRHYRATTVVSERERQLLQQAIPDYHAVTVIPNCINMRDYEAISEAPDPHTLIFTGSFRYTPNYHAMIWFIRHVLPRIQATVPQTRLIITGDSAGKELPPGDNVIQTGRVADVRPLVARATVSIAPLFQGGGTRLKILEAMALRTPVVATTKGAEGLDVIHGQHLLIADSARDFAQAVGRLLQDPTLRQKLIDQAYSLVNSSYNWPVVIPRFLQLVERTASIE